MGERAARLEANREPSTGRQWTWYRSVVTRDSRETHDANAIIDELVGKLRTTARDVVPWFLSNMPRRYFQDTEPATRLQHLAAILAMRASALPIRLSLETDDDSEWTFIQDRDYPGLLSELLDHLPDDRTLASAKVHTSANDDLVLDVFRFAPDHAGRSQRFDPDNPEHAAARDQALEYARTQGLLGREGRSPTTPDTPRAIQAAMGAAVSLEQFIASCGADYITTVTPFRVVDSWQTCRDLFGTDDTRVILTREEDRAPNAWRVAVFTGNALPNAMLSRISGYTGHAELDIQRAYLDRFHAGPGRTVLVVSIVVLLPERATPGHGASEASDDSAGDADDFAASDLAATIRRDLTRIKWMDDRVLALAYGNPSLGLLRAEVIYALAQLAHPALAQENRYAFSRERIVAICEREIALATEIADLFLALFGPEGSAGSPGSGDSTWSRAPDDAGHEEPIRALLLRIERQVDEPESRRTLTQLLLAVQSTLRTNAFAERRYGLAIRFDPVHLGMPQADDPPYGAFFVTGRGFSGFHVRFRDIARGGMRVVKTRSPAHHALEVERLYREVYDLSFAQQLKNKDIPEGGAKAVILARPDAPVDRCVKAFADGLLDLLCLPTPSASQKTAHGGEQARSSIDDEQARSSIERLYLGPDENISPALIDWVVDRARRRGYPTPNAFMSSKPNAGINHKEYGVTSEGVTVFLEEALREIGIDPRTQPFTVKITGGPDGDVAGNEIRILHREYGKNARIIGIADGSGCGEDPDGLDHGELLRLFAEGLPIAEFDRQKLGPRGSLVGVSDDNGIKLRNTMHNRVVADAFVPAGGRPATINESNWRQFVHDGVPSSRVVVEGANLFITGEARKALSQHAGVVIVKDSSANKCGVICSSFEIMASMLLSSEEFLAVKEQFVAEVLERLRELARREARLLFDERSHHPDVSLPELSTRVSRVILRTTDAIESALPDVTEDDQALLESLITEHVPPILLERAGDRLHRDVPQAYIHGIIAATLATKIVYREGLAFLADLEHEALAELALRYLHQEQDTERLVAEITDSTLPNRDRIAEIIRMAGSRAGLLLRTDLE